VTTMNQSACFSSVVRASASVDAYTTGRLSFCSMASPISRACVREFSTTRMRWGRACWPEAVDVTRCGWDML
jgi:hypothetical protein